MKSFNSVGQDGKVQPGLIKRVAEDMPIFGDSLGTIANVTQSDNQQQVEQAQRGLINAVLKELARQSRQVNSTMRASNTSRNRRLSCRNCPEEGKPRNVDPSLCHISEADMDQSRSRT